MPIPKKPCGHGFCAAAYRIVWSEPDWTLKQAAAAAGRGKTALLHAAELLRLPARPGSRVTKKISRTIIAQAWADHSRNIPEIAADLGVHARTLSEWAREGLHLPSREKRRRMVQPCRWFREMWAYGVGSSSIARHMGCDMSTVTLIAKRLGLPARPKKGLRSRKPKVSDFMRDELPRLIATRQAELDRAAFNLRVRPLGDKVPATHIAAAKKLIESRGAAA